MYRHNSENNVSAIYISMQNIRAIFFFSLSHSLVSQNEFYLHLAQLNFEEVS